MKQGTNRKVSCVDWYFRCSFNSKYVKWTGKGAIRGSDEVTEASKGTRRGGQSF